MKKFNFLTDFFYSYPALYYSLFFLLGLATFLYEKFFLLIFFIFIWNKKKFAIAFLTFLVAFFYSGYFFSDIKKIDKPKKGLGLFKITSIKERYNFSNKYYIYKGNLKTFQTKKNTYKNITASIFSKTLYFPNSSYIIDGTLFSDGNYHFYIKTKKKWEKASKSYSLTKTRYHLKKMFYKYLRKTIKDKNTVNFLHALITGDNSQIFLSHSFSKIGLQHILAISGFHFSIFTLFFAFFLRLILPKKIVIYLLLILVNLYFLFLGPLISVQRAYLMIQTALFAQIVNRKYFALNALGISLIIILIINPLNLTNIGFQLSFLCSFAILLSFPLIEGFFSKIIKKRSFFEISELNIISKIALKLLNYIRQSFCLCISINLFILPVILYYFHKFAYMSIIYNLFIPFLVGISLMLIIIGALFYFFIPPIGLLINFINTFFTKNLLKLIIYPPAPLQFYLRCKNISIDFVIVYLILISSFFLFIRYSRETIKIPEYCYFL